MNAVTPSVRRRSSVDIQVVVPALALALTLGAFLLAPVYSTVQITSFHGYNALQNFAALGLVALGVGLTMIAGELDVSSAGTYAFGGMVAVTLGGDSPVIGIAGAVAVAALIGAMQGVLIAKVRINSVPITIAGFFVLAGAVGVLGDDASVRVEDFTFGLKLDEPVMTFFSVRSLIVLAMFVLLALIMTFTRLGRDVRAIGSDRDAARVAGVRVDGIIVGIFTTSAMLCALGGALLAFSLGVAQGGGTVTVAPLMFGVTAALVGGVTLAGGRGGPLGIAVGALSLSLLQQVFVIFASPTYFQNLAFGALLLLAVMSDAVGLRERVVGIQTRMRLRRHRSAQPAPLDHTTERQRSGAAR